MKLAGFEDIEAGQAARELVRNVYDTIKTNEAFRRDFRLVNQIQAAAVSVMANIAGSAP